MWWSTLKLCKYLISPQIFNLLIIAVKTCGFLFHPRSFTSLFLVIFIFMFKLFQIWSVGASLSWLLFYDGSRRFCSHPVSGTMRCHHVLFFSKPGICYVSKGPLSSYHGGWSWFTKIWALGVLSWMGGVTPCAARGTKWEVASVHFSPWTLIWDEPLPQGAGTWSNQCPQLTAGRLRVQAHQRWQRPIYLQHLMGPTSVRPGLFGVSVDGVSGGSI